MTFVTTIGLDVVVVVVVVVVVLVVLEEVVVVDSVGGGLVWIAASCEVKSKNSKPRTYFFKFKFTFLSRLSQHI